MSKKYDEYLIDHIGGVKKAFSWLCEHFPDIADKMAEYHYLIDSHDNSKYGEEEYDAYDNYFYANQSYAVVQAFNRAWLHHIHLNPHHWQYWVLIHDDEPEEYIEMPYHYVIEMICDWWSFSWKSGDLTSIFKWYNEHKSMRLHPNTRKLVEEILDKIKEELNNG